MVEKSINQIKSETFKALIGINISYSIAEDCSNLCCNLAKLNIPFLKDLITVLKQYEIKKNAAEVKNKKISKDLIAPFYSLSLIEYLASKNNNWYGKVIAPKYLISAMLIYNYENKKNFMLLNKKKIPIFCINNSLMYLSKSNLNDNFFYIETELNQPLIANIKFNKIFYFDRCSLKTNQWNELLKYSKKTYVKESKTSKEKGAGYL